MNVMTLAERPVRRYDFATEARWFAEHWGLDVEDLLDVPPPNGPPPPNLLRRAKAYLFLALAWSRGIPRAFRDSLRKLKRGSEEREVRPLRLGGKP